MRKGIKITFEPTNCEASYEKMLARKTRGIYFLLFLLNLVASKSSLRLPNLVIIYLNTVL